MLVPKRTFGSINRGGYRGGGCKRSMQSCPLVPGFHGLPPRPGAMEQGRAVACAVNRHVSEIYSLLMKR